MKRKRPETYEAEHAGRKVRVTVPDRHETVAYSGNAAEVMRDVLRDNLSPHTVATIAAYLGVPAAIHRGGVPLQPVRTMDPAILRQVTWFRELLTTVVGGEDELNRLCDEVGL